MFQQDAIPPSPTPVWLGRLVLELKRLAGPLLVSRRRGLLSITFDVPLAPLSAPGIATGHWFFWHRPASDHRLLGVGLAAEISSSGGARFQHLARQVEKAQSGWTHINQGQASPLARAFLGFAFDPEHEPAGRWQGFPNLAFIVPSLLLEWRNGGCTLTFSHDCETALPSEQVISNWLAHLYRLLAVEEEQQLTAGELLAQREYPPSSQWVGTVADAVEAIRSQELEKVVLSRTLELAFDRPPSSGPLLERLAGDFPGCTSLGACFGGATLLAATPERLLSMEGSRVTSDAIAGTLAGETAITDSAMLNHEHRPVVEAIRHAFHRCCDEVEVEPAPRSLELRELSHLATAVRGRLRPGAGLFRLLETLHPTPAVGGVPRARALDWIRAAEPHSRGWYTGAFGWIGDRQRAELAVVLRCGLLEDRRLTLYAGAGITRASDPGAELEETALKFRPLLDRLS